MVHSDGKPITSVQNLGQANAKPENLEPKVSSVNLVGSVALPSCKGRILKATVSGIIDSPKDMFGLKVLMY